MDYSISLKTLVICFLFLKSNYLKTSHQDFQPHLWVGSRAVSLEQMVFVLCRRTWPVGARAVGSWLGVSASLSLRVGLAEVSAFLSSPASHSFFPSSFSPFYALFSSEPFISLWNTIHLLSHSLTFTHSPSLRQTHTHTLTHSHSFTHSQSVTHWLTLRHLKVQHYFKHAGVSKEVLG